MFLYDEKGLQIYEKCAAACPSFPSPSRFQHLTHSTSIGFPGRITTDVPEYYLYSAELNLLKKHSAEIVDVLFPSTSTDDDVHSDGGGGEGGGSKTRRPAVPRWRVGEWGSGAVGKYNRGVNGEEGVDQASRALGRREGASGCSTAEGALEGVVLELGAGSLSKTRYVS